MFHSSHQMLFWTLGKYKKEIYLMMNQYKKPHKIEILFWNHVMGYLVGTTCGACKGRVVT